MDSERCFIMLCDDSTEGECLRWNLFGDMAKRLENLSKDLARREPLRAVCRDGRLRDNSVELNVEQISDLDIQTLLCDKLSDALDAEQKRNKIGNLLTKLRRSGIILNTASRKAPNWVLAERSAE